MKSRPDPSPAPVTKTGLFRPDATRVSLNDPAFTVAADGDARGGDGLGVADWIALGLAEGDVLDVGVCALPCAQPAVRTSTTTPAISLMPATKGDEIVRPMPVLKLMDRDYLSVHSVW